jgi:hypothetical protein
LHLARFSWKLTGARGNTLPHLCCFPRFRKSCCFEVVKETGRKGRSNVDAPWVQRIRHIEPFRIRTPVFTLQWPYTRVLFYPYSTSLASKIGAFEVSIGSGRTITWIQYGTTFMLSILVEKSKRKNKFGDKFPFSCVLCDFFLTSVIPSFHAAFRLHRPLAVRNQTSQKLNNTYCSITKILDSIERYYQSPCALNFAFLPYCIVNRVQ